MADTAKPPRCRHCGKPLRKHTATLWFGPRNGRPYPRSREEAQRLTNLTVVSAVWGDEPVHREDGCVIGRVEGSRIIQRAGTWDGESWGIAGEGLFCTVNCGYELGRRAALSSGGPRR